MASDVTVETGSVSGCGCTAGAAQAATSCCTEKPVQGECHEEKREGKGPDRRNERVDRRTGLERRVMSAEESGYTGPERRKKDDERRTGLERRRGPGRRRSDDRKAAEEGEMSAHQFEFVMAIQTYKKLNKRLYPTWTEILEIVHQLGYRKVMPRKIRLDVPEPELNKPAA